MTSLTLALFGPDGPIGETEVGPRGLTIGRNGDAGLSLPGPEVSDMHCRIEMKGDAFVLVDASANGTAVNARRIPRGAPIPLSDGDRIDICAYQLQVRTGARREPAGGWDGTGRDRAPPPSARSTGRTGWGQTAAPRQPVEAGGAPPLDAFAAGLVSLLEIRARELREAGAVPRGRFERAGPIAAATSADALLAHLERSPNAAAEISAAFAALRAHEAAKLVALQHAFRAVLGRIAPATIGARTGGDAASCWREYERLFADRGDGIAEDLAKAFAEALARGA